MGSDCLRQQSSCANAALNDSIYSWNREPRVRHNAAGLLRRTQFDSKLCLRSIVARRIGLSTMMWNLVRFKFSDDKCLKGLVVRLPEGTCRT